jgi:8-oxo-dGTP pyrophosphatase MutT (NUDIX family)
LVQAAAREVQEELGISVQITGLVGIYSHPKWHPKGHHELLFAGIPGPEPIQCAPREVIQAAFFLPSDLPEPLYLWHRTLAQDAAAPPGPCVVRADLSPPPISPIQTRDQFEVALALSGMDRPAFYAHIAATVGHTSVLANELAVDG